MGKRLDGDNAKMLCAVLNKLWNQLTTKQKLYGHLLPISLNFQDKQDMLYTAGEVRTNSESTFSYGLLHMGAPGLADQEGLTYISSVWTLDLIQRTCQKRWMIGMDDDGETQGSLCCQHNLIIMMRIYIKSDEKFFD